MSSKIKIFVIGTRGFPNIQGGVEKHCEKLYPLLSGENLAIKLFRRKSYVKDSKIDFNGIEFIDLWTMRTKYLETILHSFLASFYCLFERPDIVHIHNIGPALILPILKIARIKAIVTYHSQNYQHNKWNFFGKSILKLGEIFTKILADEIIIVSRNQKIIFHSRETKYIPNGVDYPNIRKNVDYLKYLGIISKKYLLTVARLSPEKGIHTLIKAFQRVKPKNCKLVIVGDSDQDTNYSKKIKEACDADEKIVRTGFITGYNLGQIYSHAMLFILPSYHEGLPIVALEAMSYDLPILLSDIPANREVAFPGETFPVGNVNALAEKITNFIQNPSRLVRLRSARYPRWFRMHHRQPSAQHWLHQLRMSSDTGRYWDQ